MKVSDIVLADALTLGAAIRGKKISCVEVMTAYLDHIDTRQSRRSTPSSRCAIAATCSPRRASATTARARRTSRLAARPSRRRSRIWPRPRACRRRRARRIFKDYRRRRRDLCRAHASAPAPSSSARPTRRSSDWARNTYNDVFGATLQPLRPEQDAGRISGGAGVCAGAAHAAGRRRQRSRRLAAQPGRLQQRVRLPPVLRPRADAGARRFYAGISVTGPMARTVPDLAMLLSVQAGYDARAAAVEPAGPGAVRRSPAARFQSEGHAHRLAW